jgi:hypothetical protein
MICDASYEGVGGVLMQDDRSYKASASHDAFVGIGPAPYCTREVTMMIK